MGGPKMTYLLMAPGLVDIFQVVLGNKEEFDYVLVIIAFAAASIGSFVRMAYERQKSKITWYRMLFIYLCALCVAYLCYEGVIVYDKKNWVGIVSIIGGIISVDVIRFFIDDLPKILGDALRKYIMKNDNN